MDYNEMRNELRQKQIELGEQRVNMNQRILRNGIQGLPQRKQIESFNKNLSEQSKRYGEQISDIDNFLSSQEKQPRRFSMMSGEGTTPVNPEPNVTIFPNPNLNRLRNRFKKGGSWF